MAEASTVAGAAKSIGSALLTEAKYLYGVEDELRALQKDLVCMQQFLQDVEANPNLLKQDGQLRILTQDMRELAFRAEDAIDTYLVDGGSKIFKKNFLLKFVSLASHSYPMHMLRNEIEAIQREIKSSMSRGESFRMSISITSQPKGACVGSSYSRAVAKNYIHLDGEFVVGIGDDISRLVKRLTSPQDDFQVLGIVGTGGAGKTTLASQIYRHTTVQSSFFHRAFVSVSQQWSRLDLLQRISKEILGRSEIPSSERELMTKLHDFMKDKRCLVVLDDIWKKEAWDDIYPIFSHTENVKVILTTRIKEVPRYADTKCVLHKPRFLTNDQMWELFSKRAVEGRHGIENNNKFEKLGKLMLQKCRWLPLAVVTLAGILRTKQHLDEWERVNVALKSNILGGKGGSTYGVVEDMLELSFLDLPAHLKPLFLYLAIMPEDYKWPSRRLILMWIAEGFVADDQIESFEALEDKGKQFVGELAQRYIIQVKKADHDHNEFIDIHDLMRDFCLKKASECQFLEHISSTHSYGKRSNKPRRVSIFSRDHCLEENSYLRTIVYQGLSDESGVGVLGNLESIHKDFKLLRVLRISMCANKTLPSKIGSLIHLTYLSITDTDITELPKSVRNLRNLIFLEFITSPRRVLKIPNDLVGNMENLGVLVLLGSIKCTRIGLNGEKHKKLHIFQCGAGRWMTQELPSMHILTLRDLCFINVKEIEEMEAINNYIGFLIGSLQTFKCAVNNEDVSKELKFNTEKLMGGQSLHNLYLYGRLVNNFTIQFPANLVCIDLCDSEIGEGVDLMELLGQLSKLKVLSLWNNAYLGTRLHCRGGSFPQLEALSLLGMDSLEEWIVEGGAMDCLSKLRIRYCLNLKRLPQEIRSITALKELKIEDMPEEFCRRLGYKRDENGEHVQTQEGEDYYIIQNIPSVKLIFNV